MSLKHNSDMFRDGRVPVTSLTDALQRLVQGFTSTGKMQVGSGLLGQDLHIMIAVGRGQDINPVLAVATHMAIGLKSGGN